MSSSFLSFTVLVLDNLDSVAMCGTAKSVFEFAWICLGAVGRGFFWDILLPSFALEEWDLKRRDSKTGVVFPVCPCTQRKIYNNEPALCEMNKFDSQLNYVIGPALSCLVMCEVSCLLRPSAMIETLVLWRVTWETWVWFRMRWCGI